MRLRASVDFDPQLEDYVLWSGRLNIAKALAVYEDVLETRVQPGEPRRLIFGDWKPVADPVRLCEQGPFQDVDLIRKIVVSTASPPMIRVLRQEKATEAGERPVPRLDKECKPAGEGLQFKETTRPGAQVVSSTWCPGGGGTATWAVRVRGRHNSARRALSATPQSADSHQAEIAPGPAADCPAARSPSAASRWAMALA
jgi:hypothetical protein